MKRITGVCGVCASPHVVVEFRPDYLRGMKLCGLCDRELQRHPVEFHAAHA